MNNYQKYAVGQHFYWFSFSYKGKHQGVVVIEERSLEMAMEKAIRLKLVPKNDSVKKFLLENQELPATNVLYTFDEMIAFGYASQLFTVCEEKH